MVSESASRISCEVMMIVLGKPATESRPRTSMKFPLQAGRPNRLDLNLFGRALPDHQIVCTLHVIDDRAINLVTTDTDTLV